MTLLFREPSQARDKAPQACRDAQAVLALGPRAMRLWAETLRRRKLQAPLVLM